MNSSPERAVLGLSGHHPDSAACLIVDGAVLSFDREESYSGVARDSGLPLRAARRALDRAGLSGQELSAVVFHEKPLRRFERSLLARLSRFPRGSGSFASGMSRWLGDRLWMRDRLAREFGLGPERIQFVGHMEAHAASAAWAVGRGSSAVLVMDDVGESAGTALASWTEGRLQIFGEQHAPETLGLVVAAACRYLGLDPFHHTHRLSHLAFAAETCDVASAGLPCGGAVQFDEVGALHLDPRAFDFTGRRLELRAPFWSEAYGAPRNPSSPLDPELDPRAPMLARDVLGLVGKAAAQHAVALARMSGQSNVMLGGVCAQILQVVEGVRRSGAFHQVSVAPLPGDDGTALGAAASIYSRLFGQMPSVSPNSCLGGARLARGERVSLGSEDTEAVSSVLSAGGVAGFVTGVVPAARRSQLGRLVMVLPNPREGKPMAAAQAALFGAITNEPAWSRPRLLARAKDAQRWGTPLPCLSASMASTCIRMRPTDELKSLVPDALLPDGTVLVQLVPLEGHAALDSLLASLPAHGKPPITWCVEMERPEGTPILHAEHAREVAVRAGLDVLWVEGATGRTERVSA